MIRVKTPADIPNGKHYLVIEFEEVTEDSGWGSENNSRVSAPHIYVTESVEDWTKHIRELEGKKRNRPYGVNPPPYVALQVHGKALIEPNITLTVPSET